METTQPSLLSRLRNPSDHAAWREFDNKYRELILRYARRRGLQVPDAEDVRQVVMFNLLKALPKFKYAPESGRFRSYLGKVVRNAVGYCLNRPNRTDQRLDSIALATLPDPDADAEQDELWEQEWVHHHYRLAMQTIRLTFAPRSVEVFDRLLSGASVPDVAGEFEMSTQAVHKVKQRIRQRLKELIAEQLEQEEADMQSSEPPGQQHGQEQFKPRTLRA